MKYCNKCETSKLEVDFGKDKYKSDGLNLYCKECIKKRSAEQRKKDPEYTLEYARAYRDKNRGILRKKSALHFQKNKEE